MCTCACPGTLFHSHSRTRTPRLGIPTSLEESLPPPPGMTVGLPPPGPSPHFCPAPSPREEEGLPRLPTPMAIFFHLFPHLCSPTPSTAAGPAPASPRSCPALVLTHPALGHPAMDTTWPSRTRSSSLGLSYVGPALSSLSEALDPSPSPSSPASFPPVLACHELSPYNCVH